MMLLAARACDGGGLEWAHLPVVAGTAVSRAEVVAAVAVREVEVAVVE